MLKRFITWWAPHYKFNKMIEIRDFDDGTWIITNRGAEILRTKEVGMVLASVYKLVTEDSN